MKSVSLVLTSFLLFAGCDGTNPLFPGDDSSDPTDTPDDPDLSTLGDESAGDPIERYEQENGQGGGFAQDIAYNSDTGTFSVDNLGFDGDNTYIDGVDVATLGPFQVFDGEATVLDSVTGAPISQFQHRAIYGISTSGETEFAIVRSGAYVNYGFGGFRYARSGDVTIPTQGQAVFNGDYAGIRIFRNASGTEFTTADMQVAIDFRDFNDGNAVQGRIYNRAAFASDGTPLPTGPADDDLKLPDLTFVVGPGVMGSNGILEGDIGSYLVNDDGALEAFETGKYYGILSGDDPDELVGVIVVESEDTRVDGVIVQETGGYILYR